MLLLSRERVAEDGPGWSSLIVSAKKTLIALGAERSKVRGEIGLSSAKRMFFSCRKQDDRGRTCTLAETTMSTEHDRIVFDNLGRFALTVGRSGQ